MRLLCCLAGARPPIFDKAAGAVGLYHFPPCSSSCFPAPQQAFVGEMGQRRASLAWSSTFFENGRNLVSKSSAEPHGPAAGQQSKLSTVPAAGEKTMGHAPLLKLSGPWGSKASSLQSRPRAVKQKPHSSAAGEKTMGHAPLLKLSGAWTSSFVRLSEPWVYITSTPAPVPVSWRHNKLS